MHESTALGSHVPPPVPLLAVSMYWMKWPTMVAASGAGSSPFPWQGC
jgi:hypothetical protein